MFSALLVANRETMLEVAPELASGEAVARLAGILAAIAALDHQLERCTDPRAESCLLTLRVEHEVGYLETLFGWACEAGASALVQ
jgi:hypothetical protein